MSSTTNPLVDRLRTGFAVPRPVIGAAAVAILAGLGITVGLISANGTVDGPGDVAEILSAVDRSTAQPATSPDGDTVTGSTSTLGDPGLPTDPGSPADPGTSSGGADPVVPGGPSRPESDPDLPAPDNQPPVISDVELETTGLTVVVRYRIDDPDGDDVITEVAFGGPVRVDLEQVPQGPVTDGPRGGSGSGGGGLTRPTAPTGPVLDGRSSDTAPTGEAPPTGDHGPRPIGDGQFEARFTYDRDQVGPTHTARVAITATDPDGAVSRETVEADIEAVDVVTISDVTFTLPNAACFESRAARRLFGNIDLQGAIESRNAMDHEFRADRTEVAILAGRTVRAPAGAELTVSFQPAIEGFQLPSHVGRHTASTVVDVPIGSGACGGRLGYEVEIVAG